MVFNIIILLLFTVGFFKTRKKIIDPKMQYAKYMRPFWKIAVQFVNYGFTKKKSPNVRKKKVVHSILDKISKLCLRQQTADELKLLYPADREGKELKTYYIQKTAVFLVVLFAGNLLSLCINCQGVMEMPLAEGSLIKRPAYGQMDREEKAFVSADRFWNRKPIVINIESRKYEPEYTEKLMKNAIEKMDQWILGENKTLDEVRTDLKLIEKVPETDIGIEWELDNYEYMDGGGKLSEKEIPEEGALVQLTGILSYEGIEQRYINGCKILPPILSEIEEKEKKLKENMEEENKKSIEEEYMKLPEETEDIPLYWELQKPQEGMILLLLTVAASLAIFFGKDQEISKRVNERKSQMLMDYPEIISKMILLMGAGMTIRGAWIKIAEDYKDRLRKQHIGKRYAYEEMLITVHEMQGGVSEMTAYRHFGRRCLVQQYLKLSALLVQNLKKGSRGLTLVLSTEATEAFEERKSLARKMGEEAGTKLLMPMVLMLLIVIIIVVVPAFMSFQM